MPSRDALQIGDKAPAFSLPAWPGGKAVKLSDFKGKYVILYFYPKDMTPGCTTEACDFRDVHAQLTDSDTVVLGVSTDSIEKHAKFAEKYELPFPLLADEDHAVAEKYGVWAEKKNYGKTYWGIRRATFLIDRDGRIAAMWPNVRVAGHVTAVTAKLDELRA